MISNRFTAENAEMQSVAEDYGVLLLMPFFLADVSKCHGAPSAKERQVP